MNMLKSSNEQPVSKGRPSLNRRPDVPKTEHTAVVDLHVLVATSPLRLGLAIHNERCGYCLDVFYPFFFIADKEGCILDPLSDFRV